MNRTVLIGRIHAAPLYAHTADGKAVATLLIEPPHLPQPPCPGGSCPGIPCLVLRTILNELLSWHQQGYLLKLEGTLIYQTLWYEHDQPIWTMQVQIDRHSAVDPEDYRREVAVPSLEGS